MNRSSVLDNVRDYYTGRVVAHGPTPRGVDWNSSESQHLRFEQLLRVCDRETGSFSLGDYGCGYGALLDHLLAQGREVSYRGYDISARMVEVARQLHEGQPNCRFDTDENVLAGVDYVVASGIFNVKLDADLPDWEAHMHRTLERLATLGRRGFSFNVLTSYSDRERMRPDLYYADPCFWFDHCKRRFARNVALLHDYGLYEFTILVRL